MKKTIKYITRKISEFSRTFTGVMLALFGIKLIDYQKWSYDGAIFSIWVFVLGMPFIATFTGGSLFALQIWFSIVTIGLWLSNIDDALMFFINSLEFGIDGVIDLEVAPYGEN